MLTQYPRRLFALLSYARNILVSQGPDRVFFLAVRYLSWKLRFQKRVRALSPRLNFVITTLVLTWVRFTIRLFRLFIPYKYTDADPYRCINVDPSKIEYTTGEIFSKRRGWVVDGDWDLNGDRYMNRTFALAIEQRFVEELDWEDTVLAEKYERRGFGERCTAIERLYRNIREDGYKSQRQLLEENPEAAWGGLNDAMHPLANEIAVDIGRDGELLWNICGQHRLAIAKVLDIDRIPVQVFRRHAKWQELRNAAREGKRLPESVCDHPDLQDVLND